MLMRFTDQDGREIHFTAIAHTNGGTRLMMSFYRKDSHKRAILHTCVDISHTDAVSLGTAIVPDTHAVVVK
jgi:predicted GNAT family acetyltransferase